MPAPRGTNAFRMQDGARASLPELMDMDVSSALEFCAGMKAVSQKLEVLKRSGSGI